MITASFLHCCIEVSGFFQKPPGGSFPTARRHIRFAVLFLFWYDLPGGYEFLPGDATLFAFYFRDFVNKLREDLECVRFTIIRKGTKYYDDQL
ncbi:hypothetical protein DEO72_LG10g1454 [Vigna unguiculata]|uniref:Uncharacterized protein n=1 Tax=Vigna unguiculata TaxID=3917 RepID=A0A4D6N917_VIGUN|nr:hypothetical protein DEO72_LG10g1454 [Vigna unguiculata]